MLTAAAVAVAGGGFWAASTSLVRPGGADQIGDVNLEPSADRRGGDSPSAHLLAGPVSAPAVLVTPDQISPRTVQVSAAETEARVAERFGLQPETVLWAHGLGDRDRPLDAGTRLRIPPIDGMVHRVQDGETIESLAARYGAEPERITGYAPNGVQHSAHLVSHRIVSVYDGVCRDPGNSPR